VTVERFEDTATEDEEEEFIAMQAVDRDTVDEVASEIEEEELPLESKEPISLEKPKNIAAHPKSEEERKIVEDFNALQQRMAAMLARRTDETAEEQHVSDALNELNGLMKSIHEQMAPLEKVVKKTLTLEGCTQQISKETDRLERLVRHIQDEVPEEIEKSASEAYKAAFENAAANYEQMAKEAIAWQKSQMKDIAGWQAGRLKQMGDAVDRIWILAHVMVFLAVLSILLLWFKS
jgi:hypothetical protein